MLALGFVLLGAQTIVFAHDLDLDSHSPGHVCDICVLSADLAGANVASATALGVLVGTHALAAKVPVLALRRPSISHSARGPPQAF